MDGLDVCTGEREKRSQERDVCFVKRSTSSASRCSEHSNCINDQNTTARQELEN